MKVKKLLLSVVSFAMMVSVINIVQKEQTTTMQENDVEIIDGQSSVNLSTNSPMTGEDVVIDLINNKTTQDKQNNNYLANDDTNEFVNEKGEIKVPFDEAYPEIFEEGDIAYSKETLMVKFKKSFDGTISKALKDTGIVKVEKMFDVEDASWYTCYINEKDDIKETMASVRELSNVVVAEYNFAYETTLFDVEDWDDKLSGNKELNKQWYRKFCQIEKAWQHGKNETAQPGGSSSVIVAVIDTGVDYTHKDLASNIWKNTLETPDNGIDDDGNGYIDDYYGIDMTAGKGSGMDDHGHGTHVAGIIGAGNNKEGIIGIAYNTQIMPIKAGDHSGYFLQSDIANAILYALKHGADVINMSFGGSASSIAVQDALALAYNRCILVASAGNDGAQNEAINENAKVIPNYPAALSYVIGVMSIGEDYVESSFTNFDAFGFNSVEYEVYAPGESIISTIPGDRYAKMSGTSMAAPIVAAQAALLRSYYTDRNTYPTKFIYGQIVGTATTPVECLNPASHLDHNIPGVVNFYDSLTSLPTPDVGMSDYTIFDSVGLENDTTEKNNGDGIVDSGETIALGLTLRNRWGMSKDTIVSITTKNESGGECPYVTILNNDIDYGSVGTYSETDSGKVYTEDTWTGWENPFYLHISEDCPNDYSITLNITTSFKNGLDTNDNSNYSNEDQILIKVKNGVVIPYYIDTDTVLTKDNYYIIPSAVTVAPNATLRVEPGTKIQFWANETEDAYAEDAIVNLTVNGNFICEGTEEEPIEIFPSEWFSDYAVMINSTDKYRYTANITLKHTKVVNPIIKDVSLIENCEFTQNYPNQRYKYNVYSSNKIQTNNQKGSVTADIIKGSLFYKLSGASNYSNGEFQLMVQNTMDSCMFVDCFMTVIADDAELTNNVFYGNNSLHESGNGGTSSIKINNISNDLVVSDFFVLPETGNTYMAISSNDTDGTPKPFLESVVRRFMNTFNGEYVSLNSIEETNLIANRFSVFAYYSPQYGYGTGIRYDESIGAFVNDNGTIVPSTIHIPVDLKGNLNFISLNNQMYYFDNDYEKIDSQINGIYTNEIYKGYDLLEIPTLYPINISLPEYITNMEVGTTYQIHATTTPNNKVYPLVYTSENTEAAIVDENGLVTAVGAGTTNIRVYSEDLGTYNYLTINVSDKVELESIGLDNAIIYMNRNETRPIRVNFYPSNSTQRQLTYLSSDQSVVKVNEYGYVEAINYGSATITIQGENDALCELLIVVSDPAKTLYYDEDIYYTNLTSDDGNMMIPLTDLSVDLIEWTSSNPEVCYVDDQGQLIKLQNGFSTIRSKDKNSDAYDDIQVVISDEVTSEIDIKKYITQYANTSFILTESGDVWHWSDHGTPVPKKMNIDKAIDIAITSGSNIIEFVYLTEDGKVYEYVDGENIYLCDGIISFVESFTSRYAGMLGLTKQGNIIWFETSSSPDKKYYDISTIQGKIVKIAATTEHLYALTEDGYVYGTYDPYNSSTVPQSFTLLDANVNDIYVYDNVIYADKDNEIIRFDNLNKTSYTKPHESAIGYGNSIYYIDNGKVIKYGDLNTTEKLSTINNAKELYVYDNRLLIETEDHALYAFGNSNDYELPLGVLGNFETPQRVYLGTSNVTNPLELVHDNLVLASGSDVYPTLRNVGTYTDETKDFTDYIAISTKEDLLNITDLDGKYYLANDIEFTSTDFSNSGICYNDGNQWLPIGTTVTTTVDEEGIETTTYTQEAFTGVFDGNGHTISGIRGNVGNTESYGLFGINKGTITNVTLEDVDFDMFNESITKYAGLIAGQSIGQNAEISNSVVNGLIKDIYYRDYTDEFYCGGIVGYATNSTIKGCINHAEVHGQNNIGGIVGYANGGNLVIDSSYNTGRVAIFCNSSEEVGDYYVGGIAAKLHYGTISNCYADCKIDFELEDVNDEYNLFMGGIAGYLSGAIENSFVAQPDYDTIGEIAAVSESGKIENCYVLNDDQEYFVGINNDSTINNCHALETSEVGYWANYQGFDFINTWEAATLVGNELVLTYNDGIVEGMGYESIKVVDKDNKEVDIETALGLKTLHIKAKEALIEGETYKAIIPMIGVQNHLGSYMDRVEIPFIYQTKLIEEDPNQEHELVVDEEIVANRDTITQEEIQEFWSHFVDDGLNTRFYSNVILNRLNDTDVSKWLRIRGNNSSDYKTVSFGGNYWGTLDEELINQQIFDFEDYGSLEDVNHGIFDQIPEDTYPFVVNAYLEVDGEQVDTVGNQKVAFIVEFNRDMDTTIDLDVKFGSYYPYADYKVEGEYVDARTWKGEMQLTTIIENGYQYWSVSNGKAQGTSYKLSTDWGRFPFMIDTSSAQALIMQADANENGIHLTWTQDDFETLAGYNVYRSTEEDGYYTRINRTLIPAETKEWLDTTVEPGQKYYYNFTVLKTDLTESEPSGKVSITALDTMAPDIYHTPVYEAFTGNNLIINATVTDNIAITGAKVYYRITGTEEYHYADMIGVNDKYTAIIPSEYITTDGLEYYIEATDGVSYTYFADDLNPYQVTIMVAVSQSQKGDVDGVNGITLQDAMKVLFAINDRYNMTAEEFARADIDGNGKLEAYEALIIIQYVSGKITSIPVLGN